MLGKSTFVFAAATCAVFAVGTHAATIDWDGEAGDGLYMTPQNWVGDTLPANNDFADNIRFGNTAATPETVTLTSNRSINDIIFTSAGWTIAGNKFNNSGVVRSSGLGTNTIANELTQQGGGNWNVSVGNTLVINNYYQRSFSPNFIGGGTVQFTSAIAGFGGSPGDYGIRLVDITAVFDNAALYGAPTGGAVFINDVDGILQIQTTVNNAQSLIGSRIIDGVGDGLEVIDLGNGYVQVSSVIPEPASLGLLSMGALGLMRRRDRR
ncbi:MAG: PEP-CTERM sorting domain-containing protein [Phycisphaerae bacterium]